MNRANFGNQITNGMQILSVAGTTAAGAFNKKRAAMQQKMDAANPLNNLTLEENQKYGKYRADAIRSKLAEAEEDDNIDVLMGGDEDTPLQTSQMDSIYTKVNNDTKWGDFWRSAYKEPDEDIVTMIKNMNKKDEGEK